MGSVKSSLDVIVLFGWESAKLLFSRLEAKYRICEAGMIRVFWSAPSPVTEKVLKCVVEEKCSSRSVLKSSTESAVV